MFAAELFSDLWQRSGSQLLYQIHGDLAGKRDGLGVRTDLEVLIPKAKLFADTHWALHSPDVAEKLASQGWDISGSAPAEFAVVLKSELDKWSTVVKGAKIKEN